MKVLAFIMVISFFYTQQYKKRNYPYGIIISRSKLIVAGEITDVFTNEYKFHVSHLIKGKLDVDKIRVTIWKEWESDKRVNEIQKGQRLLLFLTESSNSNYEPFNGSRGELFIVGNDSLETFGKNDFPKFEIVKEGITYFLEAFEFKGNYSTFSNRGYFKRLIKQKKIENMKWDNIFFKFIIEEMSLYEIK